ncbi:MAG TPA: enoyl-CoA hydratase-related protein, partial [Dehalococcoidia bacterium]|nr:enoyl-CoA hydratase-related protein [Dehalococcoidia bacterium]
MATQTGYEDLIVEREGRITTITLNRPERLNAISGPMLSGLSRALMAAEADAETRAIILTGAGRGFCAGLDLKRQNEGSDSVGEGPSRMFDLRNAPPMVIHNVDKPIICALNGAAAGYGMDLALGCDIRVASDQAKLAAVFAKRGVLPESGGTWLLPRLIGWAKAAEIAYRGMILDAQRSLEYGLVNTVVPHEELLQTARAWAEEIAANAPLAVQATKRMMRLGL